jgi:hypothetical protein
MRKGVSDFEDYLIGSDGYVFSLKNGSLIKMKARMSGSGYLFVSLYKNGKYKNLYIHRLVASHFIKNPLNKPEVNHKNGIKTDNRVKNLEWCTSGENKKHAFKNGLSKISDANKKNKVKTTEVNSIPVAQYCLDGSLIKIFKSSMQAQRETNARQGGISDCLRGKNKTHRGYIWKYAK